MTAPPNVGGPPAGRGALDPSHASSCCILSVNFDAICSAVLWRRSRTCWSARACSCESSRHPSTPTTVQTSTIRPTAVALVRLALRGADVIVVPQTSSLLAMKYRSAMSVSSAFGQDSGDDGLIVVLPATAGEFPNLIEQCGAETRRRR